MRIAIASSSIAAAAGTWLLAVGASRGWRLLALPPVWLGALCLTTLLAASLLAMP